MKMKTKAKAKAKAKISNYLPKHTIFAIFVLFLFIGFNKSGWGQTQSQLFTSNGTFTPGQDVTSVTVECWGGGGRGGSRLSSGAGGGAGGGAYSRSVLTVIPGNSYTVNVGAGSTSTSAGGDSWFINNNAILAKGGNSVAVNTSIGASGGSAEIGIGDIKYSGGNGANGHHGSGLDFGGGGGSSAGTEADGNDGIDQYGGIAPIGGGDGGNGKDSSTGNGTLGTGSGTNGFTPGGGGGGALRIGGGTPVYGGNGANGRVVITWCIATEITIQPSNSTITYGDATSFSVTASNGASYQWEEYVNSWIPLSNAGIYSNVNTPTLDISKATVSMNGYKYRCVVSGDCEASTTSDGNATLFVEHKFLDVTTISGQNKYFGQSDPLFTYDASGFVPGENTDVLNGELSRFEGDAVGTYAVTIGSLTGANYSINFTSADFEIRPAYLLNLTVFLQASYNSVSGQMSTDLNSFLPTCQPFNDSPWNYNGTEILPSPLSPNVVDWVLVELRSDETTLFERKAGLLYNDGHVRVSFTSSSPGGNYIVVWHRNHMPVMSALNINLPIEGATLNLSSLTNLYGNDMEPAVNLNGDVYGMIAGDVTQNGLLKYTGPGNDRGLIIAKIIAETGSNNINGFTSSGYWREDGSMNSIISYLGSGNDRGYIINNLGYLNGTPSLNNTYTSVVPGVYNGGGKEGSNDGPVDIQFTETSENLTIDIVTNELIENGIVDNIQLTLAWKKGDSEIEELINTFTSCFNLLPQSDIVEVEGNNYQVFVSITPTSLPQAWNPGETITAMTFDKEYGQLISNRLWIADNDYTSDNNGEYYLSNLGADITGLILSTTVGTETLDAELITMYPNPVTEGNLFIQLSTSQNEILETEIWDMTGKLVTKVDNQTGAGTISLTIDVSKLNTGMYVINIVGDKVHYQDRFIVK